MLGATPAGGAAAAGAAGGATCGALCAAGGAGVWMTGGGVTGRAESAGGWVCAAGGVTGRTGAVDGCPCAAGGAACGARCAAGGAGGRTGVCVAGGAVTGRVEIRRRLGLHGRRSNRPNRSRLGSRRRGWPCGSRGWLLLWSRRCRARSTLRGWRRRLSSRRCRRARGLRCGRRSGLRCCRWRRCRFPRRGRGRRRPLGRFRLLLGFRLRELHHRCKRGLILGGSAAGNAGLGRLDRHGTGKNRASHEEPMKCFHLILSCLGLSQRLAAIMTAAAFRCWPRLDECSSQGLVPSSLALRQRAPAIMRPPCMPSDVKED